MKQNFAEAASQMPRFMHIEKRLVEGILKGHESNPTTNYSNGFKYEKTSTLSLLVDFMCFFSFSPRNLPFTLQTFYVHAYQSYLWNKMASRRIALFGADAPVEGDLVLPDTAAEVGTWLL